MLDYARRSFRQTRDSWPKNFAAWRRFWTSYHQYGELAGVDRDGLFNSLYPCLHDDTAETVIEPVYFYQDAWAFERIFAQRPEAHVDVGSHHKFVALLSKVVPLTMVDIRPLSLPMETIRFQVGSILEMPFADSSLPSLSSICVIEHIGLGRYGDPLDPQGTEKALAELKRVVARNGHLYISLPVDDVNRTYFNAHRAFKEEYLLKLFEPFTVLDRRYIYGYEFGDVLKTGFGIGCYHLHRPAGAV